MKSKLIAVIVLLILFAALVINWPANPLDRRAVNVTVEAGSSVRSVQDLLKTKKVLPAVSAFRLLIKLSGAGRSLKAGEYVFSPSDPLCWIIWKLTRGEVVPQKQIRVTFPEGASIYRMSIILKDKGYQNWKNFRELADEGITAGLRERHFGIFKYISSESLEGYLFPDTYWIYPSSSAEVLAEVMVERFESQVIPLWKEAKGRTKLSLHEILTMASIVEKEARMAVERPIIASVFYNRLKAGMPLAADPTIKYALERPTKVVYLDQLSVNSPYNTYKRKGLPPGPICNPGIASIKAALYPAKTDYYFFVAKNDGSHVFSRSWPEHQKARRSSK